jgi:peroxiredoxin
MKKLLAALVLTGALLTGAAHAAEVEIGKPAPDFTFTDSLHGETHKLSDFNGKTVVLEWTNPDCPFVHKFYDSGMMPKFQQTNIKNLPVTWIAINSSGEGKEGYLATDADVQKWAKEKSFSGNFYVRDPKGGVGHLYGAKTSPHMFVIDQKGNLAYQGAIDSIKSADPLDINKSENYVMKTLQGLADGARYNVTSTEPYGCGVKYAN